MPAPPVSATSLVPCFSSLDALQQASSDAFESITAARKLTVAGRSYRVDSSGRAREKQSWWRRALRLCFDRCFGHRDIRERERDVTAALQQLRNQAAIRHSVQRAGADSLYSDKSPCPEASPLRPKTKKRVHFSDQVMERYFEITDVERAQKAATRAWGYVRGAKRAVKCAAAEVQFAQELTEAVATLASLEASIARGSARAEELAKAATAMAAGVVVAKAALGRAEVAYGECRAFAQEADEAYEKASKSTDKKAVSQAANKAVMKANQAALAEERALQAKTDTEDAGTKVGNLAVAAGVARPAR